MTKKNAINENYVHACNCSRRSFDGAFSSISDLGYSFDEFKSIYDFYVVNAPIKKDSKSKSKVPAKWLGDYGWKGSSLHRLEQKLLKSSGIPSLVILKSDSIDGTLESMGLEGEICIQHPRAVMKTEAKVSVKEDGTVSVSVQETRMVCLFRHIRNSLAHGFTYVLAPDALLLEDRNDEVITARILIRPQTLSDWIDVVRSGPDSAKAEQK